MVIYVYKIAKIHQTECLRSVHITVCKLHLKIDILITYQMPDSVQRTGDIVINKTLLS